MLHIQLSGKEHPIGRHDYKCMYMCRSLLNKPYFHWINTVILTSSWQQLLGSLAQASVCNLV